MPNDKTNSQMSLGAIDSIILLLSTKSDSEFCLNILDAIEHCEQTSNSIKKSIDNKLTILEKIKALAERIVSIQEFLSENMFSLIYEISTDSSIGDSAICKSAASSRDQAVNNRQKINYEVNKKVLEPINDVLKTFAIDENDVSMYKKMDKMLKKLEKKRKVSALNFKKNMHLFTNKTDALKPIELTKEAIIDYFSHICLKNLVLSKHTIRFSAILQKCIEKFIGRQYACSLNTSENVLKSLELEIIKDEKLVDEQLADLDSFRRTRHNSSEYGCVSNNLLFDKLTEMEGYLSKCSNTIMRKWHKKKCVIKDNHLLVMSDNERSNEKLEIPLLTSSIKTVNPESRKFTLVCNGDVQKIQLMAESLEDMNKWIKAIRTVQSQQIYKSICEANQHDSLLQNVDGDDSLKIIKSIRKIPGNDICCDCEAEDPQWISINFGILLCIECCGIHREMSAQISRTQSLFMDKISEDNLKIAENIGNRKFNSIFCSLIENRSITKLSPFLLRQKYIHNKYKIFSFACKRSLTFDDLFTIIDKEDYSGLLIAYSQQLSFLEGNPNHEKHWNALMYAVNKSSCDNMGIVLFILYNCQAVISSNSNENDYKYSLNYVDIDGNSIVHLCARTGNYKILKMVINAGANPGIINNMGEDGMLLSKELGDSKCYQILLHYSQKAKSEAEIQRSNEIKDNDHMKFRSNRNNRSKIKRSVTIPTTELYYN